MVSKKYLVVMLALCLSGAVWAVTFVDAGQITLSSAYSRFSDMSPQNVINGSGLAEDLTHSNNSLDLWTVHLDDARWGQFYPPYSYSLSPSGLRNDGWIAFEFSTPQEITNMWVWNYNQGANSVRGFRGVAVDYSVDGTNWVRLGGGDTYLTFALAPGADNYVCNNVIDFGGLAVKKVCLTQRFAEGNLGDGSYAGLSEVRFEIVPEPATMLLLGLGGLSVLARKRS